MLAKDDVAEARLDCALALDPDFPDAAAWLGDLQYRAGRLSEAIATYERARARAGWTPELQQKLEDCRKEEALQRRFRQARTEHFIALFERPADEDLAREIMARLEAAYGRIGDLLGAHPSRPITIVLYTREQFDGITRLAAWSAAAYDGRIRLPISGALDDPEERDRVLSHEYVHAVVAMLGGRAVPAWMNEGLATALETSPAQPADDRPSPGAPALGLSKLERGFIRFSTADAEAAYSSSAYAVRRLIEQRGVTAIVALLHDLARGVPFPRAFRERLGMSYGDFAARVVR